jgi:hypothetical protein
VGLFHSQSLPQNAAIQELSLAAMKIPKPLISNCLEMIEMNGGDDGARTRDLRRDRPAF